MRWPTTTRPVICRRTGCRNEALDEVVRLCAEHLDQLAVVLAERGETMREALDGR